MTKPDWLESGELCVRCGGCCGDITTAPITLDDLQALMDAYGLTLAQAREMAHITEDSNELVFDSSKGYCKAMRIESDSKGPQFFCGIYEHRPAICHRYRCMVLTNLDEYLACDGQPPEQNLFHGVAEEWLLGAALAQAKSVRASFVWDFERPDLTAADRTPMHPDLKLYLGHQLVQIEPSFPPK